MNSKKKVPHLAILLATYNGEAYLQEQLRSLMDQSHKAFTLYIHDDDSTDETSAIIKKFQKKHPSKIHYFDDDVTLKTAAGNFNYLLQKVDADYFMFCDQDDIWFSDKVERTLHAMRALEEKHQDQPCMLFSDLEVVDEQGKTIADSLWRGQKLSPQLIYDTKEILALNVVTGCTIMINNSAKAVVSPIPAQDIEHDHWIAIHLSKYGYSAFIDAPLMKYRQHSSNTLGANDGGLSYLLMKTKKILQNRELFIKKYSHFRFRVSLPEILLTKIRLNLYRLLK